MKSNYEEKKAAKIERYSRLAAKNVKESESRYQTAKAIGSFIPMGQPILVGHHSEGRHRSDLKKIDNNMRKSIEADKKADYYANKAENAENSNAISSDDPTAIEQLKKKLAGMERCQELMKSVNKIIKNKKLSEIQKIEMIVRDELLSEANAIKVLQPDYCGRVGFASYSLTNNNANMSTVKKRIEKLEAMERRGNKEYEINGVKIVENADENRIQMFYDGKPSDEIRTQLKRNGFRWSPYNTCWQSFYSAHAIYQANIIAKL